MSNLVRLNFFIDSVRQSTRDSSRSLFLLVRNTLHPSMQSGCTATPWCAQIVWLYLQVPLTRAYSSQISFIQTTNPRALDVATEVLKACTPAVRANIKTRGREFQDKMLLLCAKHPSVLKTVTGNGLLQAVHLQPNIPMFGGNQQGTQSFLAQCRKC